MPSAKQEQSKQTLANYMMIVVLVCLLAVVATVLVGRVLVLDFLRNQKVIAGKTTADVQLDQNLAAVSTLKDEYSNLGSTTKLLDASLPVVADYPGLVSTLANIAGQSGLRLKTITPSQLVGQGPAAGGLAAASPAGLQTYGMTIDLEGKYDSLQSFLKNMELSARQFKITSFKVTGTSPSVSITMDVVAYHQPAPTILTKTEVVK
jgi:Tfp pilus assembly protein PilO